MWFRFSLSLVLIAIGISSPWLVRDWLDAGAARGAPLAALERMADRARLWIGDRLPEGDFLPSLSFSGRGEATSGNEASSRRKPPRESVSGSITEEPGEQSESLSYPLASAASRVLKRLVPDDPTRPGPRSAFDSNSPVQTDFSRAVVEETRAKLREDLEEQGLKPGDSVFVRIFKEENELEVWMRPVGESVYVLLRTYPIRHRSGELGPKLAEGDGQAPEGFYYVSRSRLRPATRHHLGLDLGYPNEFDRALGRGGDDILIHGGTSSAGSFALAPEHMNELYTLAEAFTRGRDFFRVHVFPFRMTDRRMEREWKKRPRWLDFWTQLKEGYDFFENAGFPPDVVVEAGAHDFRFP